MKKWKSRFVALGNRLFDFFGGKIEEELRHFVPSSLAAVRLSVLWELMVPDGVGLRGDVPGAYLTSKLSGPETYIEIPKDKLPPHWNQGIGYRRPVRRVTGSLSGLPRGDTDWGTKAEKSILRLPGAEKVVDFGEGSLFSIPASRELDEFLRKVLKIDKLPEREKGWDIVGRPELGWRRRVIPRTR